MVELVRHQLLRSRREISALAGQPRRLSAWLLLLALVAVTGWNGIQEVRHLRSDIEGYSRLSAFERGAAPARAVGLDPAVLVRAERAIPPDATFEVVTGPGVRGSSLLVRDGLRPLAAYWLLPRRLAGDPRGADWILSYGADVDGLDLRYSRIVRVAPGIVLAEVAR